MQRTRTAFVTVVSFGILSMNAQVFSDGDPEGLLFSGHTGGFLGQGVSCVDFNNDGLDDLTFTQYEGQLLAYTNEGQGTFLPADLGVSEYLTQPKAVYWVDLDNDGDKDLFVTQRLAKNELFVRLDGGDLVRVPGAGGLGMAGTDRTYGASMADFDNDGLLDVYLCNYHSPAADNATNALLRNMGGVDLEIAFEDVTESSGTGNGIQQSFQSTWVDVDRDGWLDLHVVNDRLFWPDVLFRNNGDGTFQDMATDWGLAVEAYSMSSSFADFDKDQDWDVVSTNGANEGNHFRRCVGQPFASSSGTAEADLMYEEVASEAGILLSELAWGANWFDADNDGWLDLYIATGTSLYSDFPSVIDLYPNSTNGLFMNDMGSFPMEDASDAVNPFNELTFSVGCADFNLDGALDLVSHQIGTHAHLMNGVPNGNHWVSIALEASQGCPDAIGAVVTCWKDGLGDMRTVFCGSEYLNQNSQWLHFGLGASSSLDSVVVQWPWGLSTTHLGLEVDGRHILSDLGADNGSEGTGCTYTAACNFDPTAIEDDGSCDLSCICGGGLVWDQDTQTCVIQCVGDLNFDQSVSTTDLLYFLSVYGLECG
ncbi:MAG: hypothetical protein CL835_01005 [Crocinitomicaceae bacterium]|nr:hypothetical protein [Crocinitomicaceae bacterium]